MSNRALIFLGLLVVAAVLAVQQHSLLQLRRDLGQLRDRSGAPPAADSTVPATAASRLRPSAADRSAASGDPAVSRRLLALEDAVAQFDRASDYLMDRGQLPPTEAKLEENRLKFLDLQASDRDRLNALRFLRRNQATTPDVLQAAAAWLRQESDPNTTRSLLETLGGLGDPALLDATLQLATANKDNRVRERAIRNLQAFAGNPQVEALLWTLASSDPSLDLRRLAEATLLRLPVNEQRLLSLRQQALDTATPLDQRTLSLRMMQQARADIGDVALSLAQAAQVEQDKARRLQYMQMFDAVTHPAFLPSIVQGVQDSDPDIRVRAADALRDYRNDATALQWLQYLAQSDPDERVRREAAQAFPQNRGRRGP
jgi:HEAT repeat protein